MNPNSSASAAAQQQSRDTNNRIRSLSMSLPWRRPKSNSLAAHTYAADMQELPQQLFDLAIEDEDDMVLVHHRQQQQHLLSPPQPRPRRRSHGQPLHDHLQPQHNYQNRPHGIKGYMRRASVSLRGMVHRRPSFAANELLGDASSSSGRPLTSHPGWNRSRSSSRPGQMRHSRSFYGFDLTHEPDAMPPLPQPRPGVDGEPPVIPYNTGAAAKASAAIQNEYLARQSQQQNRLLHPSSTTGSGSGIGADPNDDESGVGIVVSVPDGAREAQISRVDFVTRLPTELAIHVLGNLDAAALAKASLVSRDWQRVVSSQHVWRESCLRETTGTYAMSGAVKPDVGLGLPASEPGRDWRQVYRATKELQSRWKQGSARPVYLNGHTDSIYCLQFDE